MKEYKIITTLNKKCAITRFDFKKLNKELLLTIRFHLSELIDRIDEVLG